MNMLIGGVMNQVWSLLNSMQVVQYMSLFDAKTPGNIIAFISFFEVITSFKLLDFEEIIESQMYIPEEDPFSLNF